MKTLAILISNKGTGTNLQAIITAIATKQLNAKIAVVVSDTPDAPGLKRAEKHVIPIAICSQKDDLLPLLTKTYPVDFICLAGWKQFIPDTFIAIFENKILNTHPGLIPDTRDSTVTNPDGTTALWNKGKLADKAIQNFLDEHATYAGCTNHFLSHTVDFGKVLGRCFEKIRPDDTRETLYARLKEKENKLYVAVLQKLCNDKKPKIRS